MNWPQQEALNAQARFLKNSDRPPTARQLARHLRAICRHLESLASAADREARAGQRQGDLLDAAAGGAS